MGRIPGADTLGFGFDITKRYSEDSTTQRIFREGKAKDNTIKIGQVTYDVPENIGMEPIQKSEGTSQLFSTRQQVQDHFAGKAGVTGSGFGFKGHVEASYSHISKKDRSYFYALVEASTHNYNLKLKEQRSDWFTSEFSSDVAELPSKFTKETEEIFFAFFSVYGTHYVHQVQLGGSLYYYVAIEKTSSTDESTVKTKMDLEYKALFAKTKVEAEATWKSLDRNWTESRVVRLVARGGKNLLDGIAPGFGDWKGDAFTAWTESLNELPGLAAFNLTPISKLVPLTKRAALDKALAAYLHGGIIVKADRDFTPQTPRRAYTAYPTIEGPDGVVPPPDTMPFPPRREDDVNGIQVVLFDSDTFNVLLNKVYYVDSLTTLTDMEKMYTRLIADVRGVRSRDYYCAVSVFGLSPIYYPPAEVTAWLGECGAQLIDWQKYIGKTSLALGSMCYALAGRRGLRTGAAEDFVFDESRKLRKVNATSLLFLRGAGMLRRDEKKSKAKAKSASASRTPRVAQP